MKNNWTLKITLITFFLAGILSIISEVTMRNLNIILAGITLVVIIFIGIFFDMIGIAIAAANAAPFNSMAARKVKGAKKAVLIVQHASKVSNFCNDVIGDIAGIISGTAVGIIIINLSSYDLKIINISLLGVLLAATTAALTVGGKGYGKHIAMVHWRSIVYRFAVIIDTLERKLHITLIK